jgi:hypothetical protein
MSDEVNFMLVYKLLVQDPRCIFYNFIYPSATKGINKLENVRLELSQRYWLLLTTMQTMLPAANY